MMDDDKIEWINSSPGIDAAIPELGGSTDHVPLRATWHRPRAVDLEGPWRSDLGSWHNVIQGVCNDPLVQRNVQHTMARGDDGLIRIGGWKTVAMSETSVTWEEAGHYVTWRR